MLHYIFPPKQVVKLFPDSVKRYPERRKVRPDVSGISGIKKICHPGVIKKMIFNLEKMKYTSNSSLEEINEFFQQYELIYSIFNTEYWSKLRTYWNADINILFKLFESMNYLSKNTHFIKDTVAFFRIVPKRTLFGKNLEESIMFDVYTEELINELNKNKERFALLYFNLTLPEGGIHGEHANLLVFDKNRKQIFRIEPNYGYADWHKKYDSIIEHKIKEYLHTELKDYKFIGFFPSSCKPMYHPGFCLWISLVRYFYGMELSNEKLKKVIVTFFKKEYNEICNKNLKIE